MFLFTKALLGLTVTCSAGHGWRAHTSARQTTERRSVMLDKKAMDAQYETSR